MIRTTKTATLAVLALAAPALAQLNNPGFETGAPSVGGGPFPVGVWRYDTHNFVPTTAGITPLAGNRMLQFIDTNPGSGGGLSCDVFQMVDLSAFTGVISAGGASAAGSIFVNRVALNADGTPADNGYVMILYAFANLANASTLASPLNTVTTSLNSDANPLTWQAMVANLTLPTNTTALVFRISAIENVTNDPGPNNEFAGHFADQADLRIVPGPGPIALACLGTLAVLRRRRSV